MKTRKKIIAGALSMAIMMSSAMSVNAAASDVQISASNETAAAGAEFTVEVSLANIPSTNANCCEFAVSYDASLVTIDSVTAGPLTETNAEAADSSSSSIPLFSYYNDTVNSALNVCWSTAAESSENWLSGEGVFFTITGTVNDDAAAGAVADFAIQPIKRETYSGSGVTNNAIKIGYYDGTAKVLYGYEVSDGSVTVSGSTETLYGDANNDGTVNVSDVVAVRRYLVNSTKYPLSTQGLINADVQGNSDGVNAQDAVAIQKSVLGMIASLPI